MKVSRHAACAPHGEQGKMDGSSLLDFEIQGGKHADCSL